MTDDNRPAPVGADVAEGATVLDEQQARLAALRAAVRSGQVPDDGAFDYERFFADLAKLEKSEK